MSNVSFVALTLKIFYLSKKVTTVNPKYEKYMTTYITRMTGNLPLQTCLYDLLLIKSAHKCIS